MTAFFSYSPMQGFYSASLICSCMQPSSEKSFFVFLLLIGHDTEKAVSQNTQDKKKQRTEYLTHIFS